MLEIQKFIAKNGVEVTLRPARPEDAGEIIKTVRSISPERSYVLMECYGKDEGSAKRYISEIEHAGDLLLVAVAEGAVIGALAAVRSGCGPRDMSTHVVDVGLHLIKEYRGLGIGTRMLQYAIEWAREKGFKKMVASIFTTNKRSLNLFLKAGFTEECIRRKHFRIGSKYIDEICMVKFLD